MLRYKKHSVAVCCLMAAFALTVSLLPSPVLSQEPSTWKVNAWEKPFDYSSPSHVIDYTPLAKASRPWTICASYPHLKDSYWLSVNYGMVEEAQRLGVRLRVVEAGGYPNIERQIAQVRDCVANGADVLALGTVSFNGLTDTVQEIAKTIPVIGVVNDIADAGITAKTGVSWITMGRLPGEYLAERHPAGSPTIKVAWFPGPAGSGWVPFVDEGFRGAIAGSAVKIVNTKYGDTGTEIQVILVEEALEESPDIDYIVGSAVTAEAAIGILRARGLTEKIGILADYYTHAVYRGLKRGRVIAAPTDFPVMQGRLGIDLAVRAVENALTEKHLGPAIELVTSENIEQIGGEGSLAPASFAPTFIVD
ncbi:MAG: TMAO reductase system periplasmic protein TorT [Alphaproteobacteria bacterium]